MTIFINGRFACQPQSGVQRYAREIVGALDAIAAPGEFILLSPRDAADASLARIEQRRVGGVGGHRWDQLAFARAARGGVALSLANSGPVLHPRQLVVLHDAAVHRRPEQFGRLYGAGHRTLDRLLARRARLATVSRFSQGELASVLRVARETIVVAPNGADHAPGPVNAGVVTRLGLVPQRYFVMIGHVGANKNVAVAVRAIERLAQADARLVLVGGAARGPVGIAPRASGRVIVAGRIDDAAVRGLLAHACALVFASRYEGFGLPLVEAMANGCPVLASDCGAAVEICSGAGEHFAVDDDAALSRLMVRALRDRGGWRAPRIAAGLKRAQTYRWAESAAVLAQACAELERAP